MLKGILDEFLALLPQLLGQIHVRRRLGGAGDAVHTRQHATVSMTTALSSLQEAPASALLGPVPALASRVSPAALI